MSSVHKTREDSIDNWLALINQLGKGIEIVEEGDHEYSGNTYNVNVSGTIKLALGKNADKLLARDFDVASVSPIANGNRLRFRNGSRGNRSKFVVTFSENNACNGAIKNWRRLVQNHEAVCNWRELVNRGADLHESQTIYDDAESVKRDTGKNTSANCNWKVLIEGVDQHATWRNRSRIENNTGCKSIFDNTRGRETSKRLKVVRSLRSSNTDDAMFHWRLVGYGVESYNNAIKHWKTIAFPRKSQNETFENWRKLLVFDTLSLWCHLIRNYKRPASSSDDDDSVKDPEVGKEDLKKELPSTGKVSIEEDLIGSSAVKERYVEALNERFLSEDDSEQSSHESCFENWKRLLKGTEINFVPKILVLTKRCRCHEKDAFENWSRIISATKPNRERAKVASKVMTSNRRARDKTVKTRPYHHWAILIEGRIQNTRGLMTDLLKLSGPSVLRLSKQLVKLERELKSKEKSNEIYIDLRWRIALNYWRILIRESKGYRKRPVKARKTSFRGQNQKVRGKRKVIKELHGLRKKESLRNKAKLNNPEVVRNWRRLAREGISKRKKRLAEYHWQVLLSCQSNTSIESMSEEDAFHKTVAVNCWAGLIEGTMIESPTAASKCSRDESDWETNNNSPKKEVRFASLTNLPGTKKKPPERPPRPKTPTQPATVESETSKEKPERPPLPASRLSEKVKASLSFILTKSKKKHEHSSSQQTEL